MLTVWMHCWWKLNNEQEKTECTDLLIGTPTVFVIIYYNEIYCKATPKKKLTSFSLETQYQSLLHCTVSMSCWALSLDFLLGSHTLSPYLFSGDRIQEYFFEYSILQYINSKLEFKNTFLNTFCIAAWRSTRTAPPARLPLTTSIKNTMGVLSPIFSAPEVKYSHPIKPWV